MKHTLIIAFLFFINVVIGQSIHYVNKNSGPAPEHFTNLQSAIDSASAGDIIYIMPASGSYGNATIDKRLTIYGLGYKMNDNYDYDTYLGDSQVGNITYNLGSENSEVSGLALSRITSNSVSNLKIMRCEIKNKIILNNSDSTLVQGCYFTGINIGEYSGSVDDYNLSIKGGSIGVNILNNLFHGTTSGEATTNTSSSYRYRGDNLAVHGGNTATIKNNIFRDKVFLGSQSIISNNIFIHGHAQDEITAGESIVEYNIFSTNETSYDSGNVINHGVDSIFVGYPAQGSYSFDARYQLSTNSPAIGYASDGDDCGVFDDSERYHLSGLAKFPNIVEYEVPNQLPNNGQLHIYLKANAGKQ